MPDKLLSQITDADIEAARRHLEDVLIEFRDMRVSVAPGGPAGHGLVVREADGKSSDIIRLRTAEAIRIAVKTMLEAGDA
jgi:hypothetical protein